MVKEKRQLKEVLLYNPNVSAEEHKKQTRKGNKSAYNTRKGRTSRKTTLPNYLSDEYNIISKK